MSETENQFSLARVALSAGGRAKTNLPSLTRPAPRRITLRINGERREFEVGRELTRTLTKRREVISALYGGVIERLYRS